MDLSLASPSSSSSGLEMPSDVSLRLFKEGGTFVMLDVPVGTEVGIDMKSWNTGDQFRGIKMIPPGLHFIYFSAVSKDLKSTAPRTGFFHIFQKKGFLAKKYDPRAEDFSTTPVSVEDQDKMKNSLEELDRHLGAYPYDMWRTWVSLTNRITESTLARHVPPSGRILSAPELILDNDQTKGPVHSGKSKRLSKLEMAENAMPRMTENDNTRIRYSEIPQEGFPEGASPQEISRFQLDYTWKLTKVVSYMDSPMDYLSELQFSFVTFLVGQHFESFEHWKALIHLLCHSDEALTKYPSLYSEFISDLFFQIREIPEDFFVDIVASNNFLFASMQRLINNVKDHKDLDQKLKQKVDRFEAFLRSKFDWDFDEEYDDAPVIVSDEDAVVSTDRNKGSQQGQGMDTIMEMECD